MILKSGFLLFWLIILGSCMDRNFDNPFDPNNELSNIPPKLEGSIYCNSGPTSVIGVINPLTGKTWMDRNLGASRAATSSTDKLAYGDLYQWGRGNDGHQCRDSGVIRFTNKSWDLTSGLFIIRGNWVNMNNYSPGFFWQGNDGANNPCPTGYRLPTEAEFNAEVRSWDLKNSANPSWSVLKLPLAGYRTFETGSVLGLGLSGFYWTSSVTDYKFTYLSLGNDQSPTFYSTNWGNGRSIRCIKN